MLPQTGTIFIIGGSDSSSEVIREATAHDGHYNVNIINDNMGFEFEFGRCIHNPYTNKSYACFDVNEQDTCHSFTDIASANYTRMQTRKSHYGGDLVVHNNKLTAIGGSPWDHNGVVEVLSELTGKWDPTVIPPLKRKLFLFTALSIQGNLYVFGGINWTGRKRVGKRKFTSTNPPEDRMPGLRIAGTKWKPSKAVFKFMANGSKWTTRAEDNLKEPKYYHRSIIWNHKIFHVGGCSGKTTCSGTNCIEPSDCGVR